MRKENKTCIDKSDIHRYIQNHRDFYIKRKSHTLANYFYRNILVEENYECLNELTLNELCMLLHTTCAVPNWISFERKYDNYFSRMTELYMLTVTSYSKLDFNRKLEIQDWVETTASPFKKDIASDVNRLSEIYDLEESAQKAISRIYEPSKKTIADGIYSFLFSSENKIQKASIGIILSLSGFANNLIFSETFAKIISFILMSLGLFFILLVLLQATTSYLKPIELLISNGEDIVDLSFENEYLQSDEDIRISIFNVIVVVFVELILLYLVRDFDLLRQLMIGLICVATFVTATILLRDFAIKTLYKKVKKSANKRGVVQSSGSKLNKHNQGV